MKKPLYIVTGFLDSGKTTVINHILNTEESLARLIAVIQFEDGLESLQINGQGSVLDISIEQLSQPEKVAQQMANFIRSQNFDEVWIEYNGTMTMQWLLNILQGKTLRQLCAIKRVIHVAKSDVFVRYFGNTGEALIEQVYQSDVAFFWGGDSVCFRQAKKLAKSVNRTIKVYSDQQGRNLYRNIFGFHLPSNVYFLLALAAIIVFNALVKPVLEVLEVPINTMINVFLGTVLQGIPFLMIGVLLSSVIQVFLTTDFIQRFFPKNAILGSLAAAFGGFLLPVCDCASIPVFRSLINKGVPVHVAVTFMCATTVINPVVIMSTWYAFGGNWQIIGGRVGLGIIAALIIGCFFRFNQSSVDIKQRFNPSFVNYGYFMDLKVTTLKDKIYLFFRHSQAEFYNVGKYLILGAGISSIIQVAGKGWFRQYQDGGSLVVSMLFMMVLAFFLSLCSSSDAVIARSFANQVPVGAIMAFLVFGPMMDLKNVFMLRSGFSRRFIIKLLVISFVTCFVVVLGASFIVGGWL